MSEKSLGTADEWSTFLDVPESELDRALTALQRIAIDMSVDLQRFARRIMTAPNEELHAQANQLSSAMGLVVMEIGMTRRSVIREVSR
ncbi:hypothetical protein [Terrabacter carboxydivorans]|uniref:Uncharacterized protein n=1 Tax=Terrabacter carboxydivorans TaxID=619730 RepID=A0ABP5ZNC3_9MICO